MDNFVCRGKIPKVGIVYRTRMGWGVYSAMRPIVPRKGRKLLSQRQSLTLSPFFDDPASSDTENEQIAKKYPVAVRPPIKYRHDIGNIVEDHIQQCRSSVLYDRFPDVLRHVSEVIYEKYPAAKDNLECSYYHKAVVQQLALLGIAPNIEVPAVEKTEVNGVRLYRSSGKIDLLVSDWVVEIKAQQYKTRFFGQLSRYVKSLSTTEPRLRGGIVCCFVPNHGVDVRVFEMKDFGEVNRVVNSNF